MNIRELSRYLADRAEDVARHILPNGKREGQEWRAGNLDGEAGGSLGVRLTGSKAGVWCDFATGESGDLVDLWCRVLASGNMGQAVTEIKSYCGVREPEFYRHKKSYERPKKPVCSSPKSSALEYLFSRGFTEETIKKYQIAADLKSIYFPFLREGELIMCKWRSIDSKKTAPTSAGQEPCLFGWQAIPKDTRTLYITEGEFDAMAMCQLGYPAVSVPFGGGEGAKQQWIESEYENLDRFETIYLCLDNDHEGEKAARAISERLGLDRCLWVMLPKKDANQCLIENIDITESIVNAKNFDPAQLKNAREYTEAVLEEFYPPEGKELFIPNAWEKMLGKVELREAELSLWNGMSGSGKSEILGFVALKAMLGGTSVCIASMELKPQKLLKRMVRQVAGVTGGIPSIPFIRHIQDWIGEKLWLFECTGTAKQEDLIKIISYARKRYGTDLIIIDSLMKCGLDEDDHNGQKAFIDRLCDLKNDLDFHIALVTHSKKKMNETEKTNKMDVRGSVSITDLADTVFQVWRNKIKENKLENPSEDDDISEIEQAPDVLLTCDKQRNGDWEGKLSFWFCRQTHQYLESGSLKARPMIEWSSTPQIAGSQQ